MSISTQTLLPVSLRPMLPQLARQAFDSPDHLFELKWEGIRALALVQSGALQLLGRRGNDITPHFPELSELPQRLKGDSAVLDGELVCLDEAGRPNLQYLRERLAQPEKRRSRKNSVHFVAFDVLFARDASLTSAPLVARKNILHDLLVPSTVAQVTDFVEKDGKAFFQAVCNLGLEGIVAKEKSGLYHPGRRNKTWQKVKRLRQAEFVVAGYSFGGKKREAFSSLLLGLFDDNGNLLYVGQVSTGITEKHKRALLAEMERLHVSSCPFSSQPRIQKLVYWCKPELVCTVQYGEFTEEGQLAYPVYLALALDKAPEECIVSETMGWPAQLAEFT